MPRILRRGDYDDYARRSGKLMERFQLVRLGKFAPCPSPVDVQGAVLQRTNDVGMGCLEDLSNFIDIPGSSTCDVGDRSAHINRGKVWRICQTFTFATRTHVFTTLGTKIVFERQGQANAHKIFEPFLRAGTLKNELKSLIVVEIVLETVNIWFSFEDSELPFADARKNDPLFGDAERLKNQLGIAPGHTI